MALDIGMCATRINMQIWERQSQFNCGNSRNKIDYINPHYDGSSIHMEIGMTLASRSYYQDVKESLASVIQMIRRELGIPYPVTFEIGYVLV